MTTAYLGLGTNLGDRLKNLRTAVALLREHMTVTAVSPVYETEPVGYAEQGWFLNCAISAETDLTPPDLLLALQRVEAAMGKATPFPNGPRVIDLDILLYGNEVVQTSSLQVPHPRMHQRRFVLAPLADIAAHALHPTLGITIADLQAGLPNDEQCREYPERL